MIAIVVRELGGPEVLCVEEVPNPEPGPGEVVVRLHAIGVNPVETYIRTGAQGYAPVARPYTPGSDGAGVVEAVGAGVPAGLEGTRVFLSGALTGTYAQMARCRIDQVHPLPETLTFEQGAALGVPYATAYYALFNRAQLRAGERVFVHGASGGVGLATVQLAVSNRNEVVGTAGTEEGRALVRAQGVQIVYDHHTEGYFDDELDRDGRGFNVIVEMAAHVNLGRDLRALARGGRVIVVGSRGPVEITPRDLMGRHADIRGMSLRTLRPEVLAHVYASLVEMLRTRHLRPAIHRRLPLSDAAEAHRAVIEDRSLGKIVLIP